MNNDRLKYRVWSPFAKKYYKDLDVLLTPDGRALIKCFYANDDTHEYIIEQCTGIKDSTGKLIFDNDTVTFNGREYIISIDEEGVYGTHTSPGCIICVYPEDLNKSTIIGNIHETEEE